MADIDIGDLIRLVVTYDMPEEQKAQNVFAMRASAGECTDAQLLTAAATFISSLYATVQGIIHNNVDLNDCKIVKVVWGGAEWITDRVIGNFIPTFTASDGTDMLPHEVTGQMTFPTSVPKRKGKLHLAGLTEAQQADSILVAGAGTAMANFATTMRAGFTAGTATLTYTVLGILGQNNTSTGWSIPGLVGSQRRRKPGVGI